MLMSVARRVRSWLLAPLLTAPRPREARQPTQEIQLLLSLQYRQLQRLGAPLPNLEEVGFRVSRSQTRMASSTTCSRFSARRRGPW